MQHRVDDDTYSQSTEYAGATMLLVELCDIERSRLGVYMTDKSQLGGEATFGLRLGMEMSFQIDASRFFDLGGKPSLQDIKISPILYAPTNPTTRGIQPTLPSILKNPNHWK